MLRADHALLHDLGGSKQDGDRLIDVAGQAEQQLAGFEFDVVHCRGYF